MDIGDRSESGIDRMRRPGEVPRARGVAARSATRIIDWETGMRRRRVIGRGLPGVLWALGTSYLFLVSGCSDQEPPSTPAAAAPSFAGVKLEVAALGDAAILTGLSAQRGEWEASRGGKITIREQPVSSPTELPEVDLLIFPGQGMGDLVDADALEIIPNQAVLPPQPVDDESPQPREDEGSPEPPADPFQYTDIAPAYRDLVTKYGTDRMALPLGGSALVLVYRRDAMG